MPKTKFRIKNPFAAVGRRRKKKTSPYMTEEPVNEYYLKLSERFGTLSVVLLMILPVFLFVAIFLNRKQITSDNLYYLFKDINAASELAGSGGNEFQYPRSDSMDFAVYKKGLAAIGEKELCLYTATGRQTLNTATSYSTPVVRASGKYVLTYDLGGKNVALYNSFARIFRKTYEYPVNFATIGESGAFLTVTSDSTYTSVVEVYSAGFSLINQITKNGYVISGALSDKAVHGALATVQATDGNFTTEIMTFVPGSEKGVEKWTLEGTFPIGITYLSEDRLLVVCDNASYVFSNTGRQVHRYDYDGKKLSRYAVGNGDFALLFADSALSGHHLVTAFDKNGDERYRKELQTNISGIGLCDGYLFLLLSDGVQRVNLFTKSEALTACTTDDRTLLVISKEEILLCSPVQGTYVKIKE